MNQIINIYEVKSKIRISLNFNLFSIIGNLRNNKLIQILKAKKVLLLNDVKEKDYKRFERKVRNRNVAMFYQIACIFSFSELVKFSLCYIERCFAMVCEKNNFKNLKFTQIAKIVSSSELNIDSEMEVIKAIYIWISYDFEERSKFASKLMSKVRLDLLSAEALNSILESDVSFIKNHDCVSMLTNVLKNNKLSDQSKSIRYCSQYMFDIILKGGLISEPSVRPTNGTKLISANNLDNVKDIAPMNIKRVGHRSVYCRGAVYVFGGYDENKQMLKSVERYSLASRKWEIVSKIFDGRGGFCACRFMDQIFIFGGCDNSWRPFYSSKIFDTNNNRWYEVARINKARIDSASTVYEGRIIISGGSVDRDINNYVNTVEAYDPFANSWSAMPNMIEGRFLHSSVSIRNKLYVLGSYDGQGSKKCEVFDFSCKKFVMIKPFPSTFNFDMNYVFNTFSIGNKIITIGNNSSTALYYDVEKDEWSEETFNLTKDNFFFSCTLIPQMKI